jgi:hypothetical protein
MMRSKQLHNRSLTVPASFERGVFVDLLGRVMSARRRNSF